MLYHFDTNICIDFMHGKLPYGYQMIKQYGPEAFELSSIVAAELLLGVEKTAEQQLQAKRRLTIERFLEPFAIIPFDEDCARAYARIRASLESRGRKIGPNDTIIAATALAHQAVLVTNNFREFERVPGLQIESWYDIPF